MKGAFWRLKRGLTGRLGRFLEPLTRDGTWTLLGLAGSRIQTTDHPGLVGTNWLDQMDFFPFETSALPLKFLDCGREMGPTTRVGIEW